MIGLGLTPGDVGLPSKFSRWRAGQDVAVDRIISAFEERGFKFVAVSAPVGSGKTVEYIGVALLMGWRVLVLTSTKGLQDQLLADFGGIGLVDMRGRSNFDCLLESGMTCDEGRHARCPHQTGQRNPDSKDARECSPGECPYQQARAAARAARLVVANYPYDMLGAMYGEGLGDFDLLVLDEAHDAEQQVCNVMRVELTARRVFRLLEAGFPDKPTEPEAWRAWARELHPRACGMLEGLKETAKEEARLAGRVSGTLARHLAAWGALVSDLETLVHMRGAWASEAISTHEGTGWALEPLWAKDYTARILFRNAPRVLLVSATMRPKTLELLGLSAAEVDFQDYPYVFPTRRSPVYFLPTVWAKGGKDKWGNDRMTEEDWSMLVGMVDQIIGDRLDRRGLLHTVSYDLRDKLKDRSRSAQYFRIHGRNSASLRQNLAEFLSSPPPAVFASPSIGTGFDFKYDAAEYQIIPKLPFPSVKGSAIMTARCQKKLGGDPEYSDYLMVQTLSQMLGRIMRAEDDRAETFILDCNFLWVRKSLRKHFPTWVERLIQRVRVAPSPPPALHRAG